MMQLQLQVPPVHPEPPHLLARVETLVPTSPLLAVVLSEALAARLHGEGQLGSSVITLTLLLRQHPVFTLPIVICSAPRLSTFLVLSDPFVGFSLTRQPGKFAHLGLLLRYNRNPCGGCRGELLVHHSMSCTRMSELVLNISPSDKSAIPGLEGDQENASKHSSTTHLLEFLYPCKFLIGLAQLARHGESKILAASSHRISPA
eukprot:96929-Hanusia_phi.AAC.1